jgi:hypothetical protein
MRPNHIEDALIRMHTGQWFGWTDSKNKVYANLIVHDNSITKPTEAEVNAKLTELQTAWDEANAPYKLSRAAEYPSLAEQLDYIYHNGVEAWKTDIIDPIKARYPKP